MIIYNAQRGPTMVRVINSRLPIYKVFYGDGLGNVVQGIFRRLAPKAIPIAKQGIGASKAFSAITDRLARLIRREPQPPVKLPSTEVMPATVSKIINQAANQKLAELSGEKERNITASLIAGSGLRVRR